MPTRLLDALRYPVRGARGVDAIVAVWVLLLANGLLPVVPLVPLAGYLVRVLHGSLDGRDAPPSVFEAPLGRLRRGVVATVVVVCYLGVPVGLVLLILEGVSAGLLGSTRSLAALASLSVGAVLLLAAAYLLPVGLAGFAATGRLRSAFDTGFLRAVGRSGRYLLSWIEAALLVDLGGFLVASLGAVSPLGRVLGALVGAYALLVGVRLLALGVAASGGDGAGG